MIKKRDTFVELHNPGMKRSKIVETTGYGRKNVNGGEAFSTNWWNFESSTELPFYRDNARERELNSSQSGTFDVKNGERTKNQRDERPQYRQKQVTTSRLQAQMLLLSQRNNECENLSKCYGWSLTVA